MQNCIAAPAAPGLGLSLREVRASVKKLLKNSLYITFLILLGIASYGFTITHFAMGIDDFGLGHYMDLSPESSNNMLQQGRLLHIVLYYLTGLMDVIPFLNNFISAALIVFSALLLCGLADAASNGRFNTFQQIIFAGLYISSPVSAFKFIYDLDVVAVSISGVCCVLAVIMGFEFLESRKKAGLFKTLGLFFLAVSSYESFNAVIICLVLFVLLLLCLYRDKKPRELCLAGLKLAGMLACALAAYYILVFLLQLLTGNNGHERLNLFNRGRPVIELLKEIARRLINFKLFFIAEFAAAALLSVPLAVYFSVKKKSFFVFLLFAAMGAFTLAIPVVQGALYYRTCQPFGLFIAAVALLITEIFRNRQALRVIAACMAALALIWQLKDINLWFYKDWANYQKNVYAIHNIATELNSGYSIEEKPVCFVNRDYDSFLMSWEADKMQYEIGESPIVAAVAFCGDITCPELIELFEKQEYTFLIQPTLEQAQKAVQYSSGMPGYPKEGYIAEYEDIIIVKLGEAG